MVRACPSEHAEAMLLMRIVKLQETVNPELKLLFAVPNGGKRSKITAAMMKAEGVKAGVPDYFLPVARQGFHGLFIELKPLDDYATKVQKAWHEALKEQGYRVEVCRGGEAAWQLLRHYLREA